MKRKQVKYVTIKMTHKEAMENDLLRCECGYPQNNHFDNKKYGDMMGTCAHEDSCLGYMEVARVGELIDA